MIDSYCIFTHFQKCVQVHFWNLTVEIVSLASDSVPVTGRVVVSSREGDGGGTTLSLSSSHGSASSSTPSHSVSSVTEPG